MTRCTLDVGCDEWGVCYAAAQGKSHMCGTPLYIVAVKPYGEPWWMAVGAEYSIPRSAHRTCQFSRYLAHVETAMVIKVCNGIMTEHVE